MTIFRLQLPKRHITATQKAAIALDFLPELEAEALKGKKAGLPCHESLTEHDEHRQDFREELDREILMGESMRGVKFSILASIFIEIDSLTYFRLKRSIKPK